LSRIHAVFEWYESIFSRDSDLDGNETEDVNQPLANLEGADKPITILGQVSKRPIIVQDFDDDALEFRASWLLGGSLERCYELVEMGGESVMVAIRDERNTLGMSLARGSDSLPLYSRLDRKSSPHFGVAIDKAIVTFHTCVVWIVR
jgi:hypothetical protein